jgi:hypothetical protein
MIIDGKEGSMDCKKIYECLFAMFLISVFSSPAVAEQIYRWVDENGVVGFTDNPSRLPEKYLDTITTITPYAETGSGERSAILDAMKPEQTDESDFPKDLDFNGHDEGWWKNRAHDLKDRKEALVQEKKRLQEEHDTTYAIWLNPFAPGNKNIAEINKQISQGKRPDPKLFFGLPVPQPEVRQSLDDLKNQIARVDDELNEIDRVLEVDLPDEARRAGAPPGWLRD